MKDRYRVSAIVSTYKSERFIRGRLNDLLSQSISSELEIVIVNSGSPQNEDKIIREEFLPFYSNITYIRTDERETIYQAWNRGIKASKGRYITNANTDDRLMKEAFERMAQFLDDRPTAGAVYADQYTSNIENETFSQLRRKKIIRRPSFERILFFSRYFLGSQPMWRREVHEQHGVYFSGQYEVAGDYDFFLRLSEIYPIEKLEAVLGLYYRDPKNVNKEFQDADQTNNETIEIRHKYIERWVETLSRPDVDSILHQMKMYLISPELVHTVIFQSALKLNSNSKILPRGFVCYLGSLLAEKAGDIPLSLKFCRNARFSRYSELLNRRILQLVDRMGS